MENPECFELEYENEQFIFEIHAQNPAHEARIRWEAVKQSALGKWGRLYLPDDMEGGIDQVIQEPKLTFGGNETVTIDGREQDHIQLPRPLAAQLQKSLTEMGTAVAGSPSICNDPSRFPPTIDYQTKLSTEHLDKMSWDSDREIMWYDPDKPRAQNVPSRVAELISQLDVYGYQIENGSLIHRTEEYPSSEAVEELEHLFEQMAPPPETDRNADSYRIDEHLR